MPKRIGIIFGSLLILVLTSVSPVLAQGGGPNGATHLLPAALVLLLPLGLILLISSAVPETEAPLTATTLLIAWGVAVLAYFAVGFAFQFGGVAQVSPNPDLSGLYWEWYPLDQAVDVAVARLWGVIALQGWALAGEAITPTALHLFAVHLSLVGVATLIPVSVLLRRANGSLAMLTSVLMGGIVYPVGGNWLWGGGWLFNLGASLGLGHGFVDFGGSSVIFLAGSVVALLALLTFKPSISASSPPEAEVVIPLAHSSLTVYKETSQVFAETAALLPETPLPSAYLPILSLLGAGLALASWFGLITGLHSPTAVDFMSARAGVNGLLSALGAAVGAAGYSWFTTRELNPLMTSRGLLAGLVVAMAGGPFLPPWVLLLVGLILGLLLPSLIYLFDQGWPLNDGGGTLATYGVSALSGLLLVGLFADGQAGEGWNGLAGPGISGLLVAAERSGQLQAQVVGSGAVIVLAVAGGLLLFQTAKVVAHSWASTGLELADSVLVSKVPDKSRASTTETLLTPGQDENKVQSSPGET